MRMSFTNETSSILRLLLLTTVILLSAACSSSSTESGDGLPAKKDVRVAIAIADYTLPGVVSEDDAKVEQITAFLFKNGVLEYIYPNLNINTLDNLSFSLVSGAGVKNDIYFLANYNRVTASVNPLTDFVVGQTTAAQLEQLTYTIEKRIAFGAIPMFGRLDLREGQEDGTSHELKLRRSMARVDLKIEESGVAVTSVNISNLNTGGSFHALGEGAVEGVGELFDYKQIYETPLTASQSIGYINEQRVGAIPLEIAAKFNDLPVKLTTSIPAPISRNSRYTVRLVKVGATLTATVSVSDWEDGGVVDATPDVDARVLIDPESSSFPEGVTYSATLDTLFVKSSGVPDFVLAFNSDYPVSVDVRGNSTGIQLTPIVEATRVNNRFNFHITDQIVGNPAYYSYLEIQSAFFEDYYGQRVVIRVAPNTNIPFADPELLATIDGITNSASGLQLSPYGDTAVVIPSTSIKVNGEVMSEIVSIEFMSVIPEGYKAILATRKGNSIEVNVAPNTTGRDHSSTMNVYGRSAAGTNLVATVSLTIPAISPLEMQAYNSMIVEMGGKEWMQFNTSGSVAGDVARALAISALPDALSLSSFIYANYPLFGADKSIPYTQIKPCPKGFTTPSQQDFCNLFAAGEMPAHSFSHLSGVAQAPVAKDDITFAYKKISNEGYGQAVVVVEQDGRKMFLTNGRMATSSGSNIFEFWYTGTFAFGPVTGNNYNFARRCIRNVNYNGL